MKNDKDAINSDLTFLTNERNRNLLERFQILNKKAGQDLIAPVTQHNPPY